MKSKILDPYVKEYQQAHKNILIASKMWIKSKSLEEQKLLEDYHVEQMKHTSHALYYLAPYYNSIEEILNVHA